MNTKNLIEAVKFQVSVKPQDDFMREVAEGLEKLFSDNMKLLSDYDAACDELKKWQKLQPIGCPACHRGCFSNDKFCPYCGTSLRKNNATTEKTSATEMTEKQIIKDLSDWVEYGDDNGYLLSEILDLIKRKEEQIESLIAGQKTLQKYIAEKDAEIEKLRKQALNSHDVMMNIVKANGG